MRRLRRFARDDQSGTATVEFVIVFPLLCLCLIAAFVFFDVFKSQAKASKALYTLSDLISRREEVNNAFLEDLFILYDRMLPAASDFKVMRISSVEYDGSNYVVDWSWVRNVAEDQENVAPITLFPHTDATLPIADLPQIADNDSVILVESYIPYKPITRIVGIPETTWTPAVIVRPRFIASIVKTD